MIEVEAEASERAMKTENESNANAHE